VGGGKIRDPLHLVPVSYSSLIGDVLGVAVKADAGQRKPRDRAESGGGFSGVGEGKRMLMLFLTFKAFSSPNRVEHMSMNATAFSRAKLHVPAKGH
jgi:hypothetical protein